MINNVVIVSGGQQRDSAIHIHESILPQTSLPSRLPYNIEQSSLCYAVGPHWLSILNKAVCTCRSRAPYLSRPLVRPPWVISGCVCGRTGQAHSITGAPCCGLVSAVRFSQAVMICLLLWLFNACLGSTRSVRLVAILFYSPVDLSL